MKRKLSLLLCLVLTFTISFHSTTYGLGKPSKPNMDFDYSTVIVAIKPTETIDGTPLLYPHATIKEFSNADFPEANIESIEYITEPWTIITYEEEASFSQLIRLELVEHGEQIVTDTITKLNSNPLVEQAFIDYAIGTGKLYGTFNLSSREKGYHFHILCHNDLLRYWQMKGKLKMEGSFTDTIEGLNFIEPDYDGEILMVEANLMLEDKIFSLPEITEITIYIPSYMNPVNSTVYRVNSDETLTKIETELISNKNYGWHIFETTESGPYVLLGTHLYGDVDNDLERTAADALLTLKHVVNLEELDSKYAFAADVDGNESVTAEDALCILKK